MKYFSKTDFEGASPPCSMGSMDPAFLKRLDQARELAGIPFIVNSAFRTVDHELKQGRDGTSSHTKGLAVDLKAETSRARFKIIEGLLEAGFTRISIGETFIHVDRDAQKDQQVCWHYYE